VQVAGVVLTRQRPGKGNAVFITLEDESGVVNALLWTRDMERQRRAVMAARLMVVEGVMQRSKEGVVHVMAHTVIDRTALLLGLAGAADGPQPAARAGPHGHPRNLRILPKSRDFH